MPTNQCVTHELMQIMVPAEGDSSLLQHQCHIRCRQYQ